MCVHIHDVYMSVYVCVYVLMFFCVSTDVCVGDSFSGCLSLCMIS